MSAPAFDRMQYLRIESAITDHRRLQDWLKFVAPSRICAWLSQELDMEVPPAFLAAYAVRWGLPKRAYEDEQLFPWPRVRKTHLAMHPAKMLKAEANVRAGVRVGETQLNQLSRFKQMLKRNGQVVDYRPHSEEVWVYVDRRPGVDDDLVRRPDTGD